MMRRIRFPFSPCLRASVLSLSASLSLATPALAHEGGAKKPPPPAAKQDPETARRAHDATKARLAAAGRYACCVKPACDLCARATGSCACAAHLLAGKGVCGECQGGWLAGRGQMKGIDAKQVPLLPSPQQGVPGAATTDAHPAANVGTPSAAPPPELAEAFAALDRAKRVLAEAGLYGCCVRPGCDMCAFEADCPCGSEILKGAKNAGVCGRCVDGWHAGHGAFEGVEMADVHHGMTGHMGEMEHMGGMAHMARVGSGTSWMPDSSPMWARHLQKGPWSLMLHGSAFLDYDNQGGPRGATRVVSENWAMAMAHRNLGKGRLMLRGMFSLDPWTVRPRGYPQLFQTGETFRGRPLIDAQHPHDLFMELAADYTYPLGKNRSLELYLAPVGEPALGPPAFMHRVSAAENPTAPLTHHWQDSTHISFGVATLGVMDRKWKLEGSYFNGREPDENRTDFDAIKFDSGSGRLSYNPSANWSFQVSHGYLKSPEQLHPENGIHRTTASVLYNQPRPDGNLALTLVWGRNNEEGENSDGYTLEGTWNFGTRHYLFGRIDRVTERGLLRTSDPETEPPFTLNAFTLGYAHDLSHSRKWETALGGMVTFYATPSRLDPIYGSNPVSFHIFLRIRPGRMEGG
jgi:hypothetical protein